MIDEAFLTKLTGAVQLHDLRCVQRLLEPLEIDDLTETIQAVIDRGPGLIEIFDMMDWNLDLIDAYTEGMELKRAIELAAGITPDPASELIQLFSDIRSLSGEEYTALMALIGQTNYECSSDLLDFILTKENG